MNRLNKDFVRLVFLCVVFCGALRAQEAPLSDVQENAPAPFAVQPLPPSNAPVQKTEKYPQLQFKGVFQGKYIVSTTPYVNVEGKLDNSSPVYNSFMVKYMRLQVRAQIIKQVEVAMLVNFADFREDPKTRVLENAFIRYTLSPKFYLTVGQFRPLFGLEELYPVDVIKSLDWSNQYYEFSKLGWTSFQLGATIGGRLPVGKMSLQYAFSVVNGNGKNKWDNDNGKLFSSRLALEISKKYGFNIGINGGGGTVSEQPVYAVGLDITANFDFAKKWNLDLQLEAKQATNHPLFFAQQARPEARALGDFLVRGIYFLPNLSYTFGKRYFNAIELSCRYEYIDKNFRVASNTLHTIMPMLGFEFIKDYGIRIQTGMQMNYSERQTPLQFDNNLFVIHIQGRF